MPTEEKNIADVPVLYSNSVRLALAFTDLKLYFGEALPHENLPAMTPGQPLFVSAAKHLDRICVVLSPEIVPQIIAGLAKAIETYQAQFGPLRKPPVGMLQPAAQPTPQAPKEESTTKS